LELVATATQSKTFMCTQTCGRPRTSLDVLFWSRRQSVCMCVCVCLLHIMSIYDSSLHRHPLFYPPSPRLSLHALILFSLHALILYLPPPLPCPIPRALSLALKATVTARAGTRERLARIFLPLATVSCIRKQPRAREKEQGDWNGARGRLAASH
jgi:hypothetical protein